MLELSAKICYIC